MSCLASERASDGPSTILIVDKNPDVRAAIRLLLSQYPTFRVVSQCERFDEALSATAAIQPDVILLDWELADRRSGQHLVGFRAICPSAAVLALSTNFEQRQAAIF